MGFSTTEGSPWHIGSGRAQVTLAATLNNQFHLLPPISASFPLSGRKSTQFHGHSAASRALAWFYTSSLGYKAHLHPGNCQLRFCCSTTAGPAVGTCLFHSRNPALCNGTELHTRDKLMQQQWHETVLFFHYHHHTRLLNSYFIYSWLPRTTTCKGGM